MFQRVNANSKGRDFVVGDLHGQKNMLDALLKLVEFSKSKDRLFALGDLVDRGPDGAKLLQMVAGEHWFNSLRGNHEVMFVEADRNWKVKMTWSRHSNEWANKIPSRMLETLRGIAKDLPMAMELSTDDGRKVGLVHAEVKAGKAWIDVEERLESPPFDVLDEPGYAIEGALLWGRQRFLEAISLSRAGITPDAAHGADLSVVAGIDQIVSGHNVTGTGQPIRFGNHVFLESGAYLPHGALSALEVHSGQVFQILRDGQSRVLAADTY